MARRLTAAERAERIMSIVPWLVEPGGVSISETCERFQIDRQELLDDLNLLFYNVGVHPFTPDALVDVFTDEDDDTIEVNLNEFFVRPLRLTPDEALAIIGAARVVLASGQGNEVLESAVGKIEAVLSADGGVVGVELAAIDPDVFGRIRAALDAASVVRITYHSFARDEVSERDVEPLRLFSAEGRWYLQGWCLDAADHRIFRMDRVLSASVTDRPADPSRPESPVRGDFEFPDDVQLVRLVLEPDDAWVPSQYPTESVERLDDGRLDVVLEVSATPWLARLLLRIDPATPVTRVADGSSLAFVRAAAADGILARYR